MVDGFNSLRHHTVIGSNYNNCNVSNFSPSSPHGCKCFMARCIKESNGFVIIKFYIICTNMLRYSSGLSCNNIGFPYVIQQRSFSVINMSHNGYNWGTSHQILFFIFFFFYCLQYLHAYKFQ